MVSTEDYPRKGVIEMIAKKEKALMSFDIDIKNRTFWEWAKAHTSLAKPLHRYEGEIILEEDRIVFHGINKQSRKDFKNVIMKERVTDITMGFDRNFKRREDRSLGLAFKPLRISFSENGKKKIMYLIISFNPLLRSSNNQDWYDTLIRWKNIENQR
mgnify:CR=1 FL=1